MYSARAKKFKIEIFDAKPEDAADIVAVQKITWLATYPNKKYKITKQDIEDLFSDREKRIAGWRKMISEDKDKRCWVVKDKDAVVAFCRAAKLKGKHEISVIYILPAYQRKGMGQALMARAFLWLGKRQNIYVHLAPFNKKAINFYKKLGFKNTDKPETPGKFPEIEMVRRKNFLSL